MVPSCHLFTHSPQQDTRNPAHENEVAYHKCVRDMCQMYEVSWPCVIWDRRICIREDAGGLGVDLGGGKGESVERIKLRDREHFRAAERAGRWEAALALVEVPLHGAVVVDDVDVVAARHRPREGRVDGALEADATAEIRAEDELALVGCSVVGLVLCVVTGLILGLILGLLLHCE